MKPLDSLSILMMAMACALLAGCAVGPDFVTPSLATPTAYKEAPATAADWKQATAPGDRGAWWTVFNDATLNELEPQVAQGNQTLAQSEAQYRQSQALVAQARSQFFPTLGVDASATRSGRADASGSTHPTDNYSAGLSASWEPDLWGRVRRTLEQSKANAAASAALLASTRLSLQAQLAQDYLQLRVIDAQKQLLDATVAGYQRSLQVTQNQYQAGVAARADVVQAQAQLESAKAQAIDLGVSRAQTEHAIAVLVGKPPAGFSLPVQPLTLTTPMIPTGVPSDLLQRRPDIVAAQAQARAANAAIGIAQAAWFPNLTLSGSGGYQSSIFSKWLTAPSRVWSLGPQLAATLFDAGARRAQTASARAGYDAAVASYRQTWLAALQNVEDELAAARILEQEAGVQDAAVRAANESLRITQNQYRAGIVSYLNVVSAQNAAYSAQRSSIALLGNRLQASVALIKALGGGWDGQGSTTPASP
ncbi:MAG: efflux transporter outer membrane subunit [Proteobacteria bacterium]|nr:efflux transporter outer membrane subunit [Pseudomonadota bacterium]